MDFSFCIFNILLANCLASLESSRNQNDVIDEDGLLWQLDGWRSKRASPFFRAISLAKQLGDKATYHLLDGAKETASHSKYFRTYQKRGGVNKAERDFEAIAPENVSEFGWSGVYGKIGTVGDRSVIFKVRGGTGKTTIEVVKTKKVMGMTIPSSHPTHVSDMITYVE